MCVCVHGCECEYVFEYLCMCVGMERGNGVGGGVGGEVKWRHQWE